MNCDTIKRLLEQLDIAFSFLRMPYGTPKEDFANLQVAVDHVKRLWIDLGLSYTPKFHAIVTHALRQMRRIGGLGCMLEDHVEKSHQEGEKHDQTVARLPSAEARTASFSHREKTANDLKVHAAKE
jgi:hypothetical protein